MTNIVNLSERRKKPEAKLPDDFEEIVGNMVVDYIEAAIMDMAVHDVMYHAKNSIYHELRAMQFDEVLARIEKEYPEMGCMYREKLIK